VPIEEEEEEEVYLFIYTISAFVGVQYSVNFQDAWCNNKDNVEDNIIGLIENAGCWFFLHKHVKVQQSRNRRSVALRFQQA
jgi:hypothetical protein